jgi:hypothetical protein
MSGGRRWISGTAMAGRFRLTEFRCPACGGIARGHIVGTHQIQSCKPEDVRAELDDFPFEFEIEEWADGKGVNVTVFPEVLKKHRKALSGRNGPAPYVLLCDQCHTRSDSVGIECHERYWQIQTRHGVLWAENRQHLVEIRDHIQLERRPQGFIKLPGWAMAAKNRDEIVKLINRKLGRG